MNTENPRRILVNRGTALGDCLMASAVLKPLREKYPNAEINFISNFPEMFGENYPYAEIMKNPKYEEAYAYDVTYNLGHQSDLEKGIPYHAPFIHLCCAQCHVRFNEPEIFGVPIKTEYTVGIVPNTGRANDTWEPSKFQELINKLNEAGFKCISFGPKDAPRFENCFNEYPEYDGKDVNDWAYGAPDMCKHVNYTARIMKTLDCVVAGDTGLFHVAAAVHCPTVLLLGNGSNDQDFWPQTRYHLRVRSSTPLVKDLGVDQVYNAVDQILFERGRKVY